MKWSMEKSWGLRYENHTRGRAPGGVAIISYTVTVQLKLIIFIYFLASENKSREEESGKSESFSLLCLVIFVWVFFKWTTIQPCASMIWTTCFRNFRVKCHFSLCQPALRKKLRKVVCPNWDNKRIILRNFIWLQKDPEISRTFS